MPWPRAAKKSGNWHQGIVDAAGRFVTRSHKGVAEKGWQGLRAEDAKSSNQGKPGVQGGGGGSRTDKAVDECRNEMADRVAMYIPVRLIRWSVCYYSPEPSTASSSFCFVFVFVEFNGESAKATVVMTCCRPFFLFLFLAFSFCCLIPMPTGHICRYLLPLVRVVLVRETAAIFFVMFCPCNNQCFLHCCVFSPLPAAPRGTSHDISESYYGSPPNFSLTKSSVSKPGPGRIS